MDLSDLNCSTDNLLRLPLNKIQGGVDGCKYSKESLSAGASHGAALHLEKIKQSALVIPSALMAMYVQAHRLLRTKPKKITKKDWNRRQIIDAITVLAAGWLCRHGPTLAGIATQESNTHSLISLQQQLPS